MPVLEPMETAVVHPVIPVGLVDLVEEATATTTTTPLVVLLGVQQTRLAVQYALWDKIKERDGLKRFQLVNLAQFCAHVIREDAMSVAALKVVEFADLDKVTVAFLKRVLTAVLGGCDAQRCGDLFRPVAASPKLRTLREGMRLFVQHFLAKDKKVDQAALAPKIEAVVRALSGEAN